MDEDTVYALEEGKMLALDFGKIGKVARNCQGVIPVAVQNIDTSEVILVAYTNQNAFEESIKTRIATFWSTSQDSLWVKGKSSGNTFELLEVYVNCEQNSLVYRVRPQRGGICHTRNGNRQPRNCYYRRLDLDTLELENMDP
jgi:phosphoribosyl-AMP cyclohydrolase